MHLHSEYLFPSLMYSCHPVLQVSLYDFHKPDYFSECVMYIMRQHDINFFEILHEEVYVCVTSFAD